MAPSWTGLTRGRDSNSSGGLFSKCESTTDEFVRKDTGETYSFEAERRVALGSSFHEGIGVCTVHQMVGLSDL